MERDWKKFRGEKCQPNGKPWAARSYPPARSGDHAQTHMCTHTHELHILTHANTPKGLHNTHTDAPSEAQHFRVCRQPSHLSPHLIQTGGETVPGLASGPILELPRDVRPRYLPESRAHPMGGAAQRSLCGVVVVG